MTKREEQTLADLTKRADYWENVYKDQNGLLYDLANMLGCPPGELLERARSLKHDAQPIDLDRAILQTVQQSLTQGVQKVLENSYSSPVVKVVEETLKNRNEELNKRVGLLVDLALKEPLDNELAAEFRRKVAKILVSKMEGSLQKSVNDLMQNPITRAKVLLSLENIVRENKTA